MAINHELWRAVAGGARDLLITKMQFFNDISVDTLKVLTDMRAFLGWLVVEMAMPDSLAIVLSKRTAGLLWDMVQNTAEYAPELREETPPLVTGAGPTIGVGGDTLFADPAPNGYTRMVYSFDGEVFAEVGTLTENEQPGVGNYVLALAVLDGESNVTSVSLPSLFLELTA